MSHSANFLHRSEPPPVHRRHGVKRGLMAVAGILLALCVGYGSLVAWSLGALYAAASDGRAALEEAQGSAARLDFDAARSALDRARGRFDVAARGRFALVPLTALPVVGPDVRAAVALAVSGAEVADALTAVVDIGADMVRLTGWGAADLEALAQGVAPSLSFGDLPGATKRSMLRRLSGGADDLDRAATRVALAIDDLSRLPTDEVSGPVLAALAPVREKLAKLERSLALAARLARVLPAFAGPEGATRTLLLFLNNAELRPGGGFIGTYGDLTVKDADIASLTTHDVYALDGPAAAHVTTPPPPPLSRYLGADRWFFRDANWSPDFAVGSAEALRLFADEERAVGRAPTAFDGVIGFTPTFVADLLRVTGPVEAGAHAFTADNVADEIEYQVEVAFAKDGIPLAQRKEILAELVDRMKEKLYALPSARWGEAAAAFERAVTGKQVLFFSRDAGAQKAIEAAGWGGAIRPPAWGDALMVVDANLASLKSDPAVERDTRYEIYRNSSGGWVGRVTQRYRHTGRFDWKTTRYRTYARVLVPAGSRFVRVEGALLDDKLRQPSGESAGADVFEENGFAAFGAFTSVEPGQSKELVFEFLLAPQVAEAIASGAYRLQAFKQAGTVGNGLTLHLNLGKNLTSASVPEQRERWGDAAYDVSVEWDRDRAFEVDL